MLKRLLCTGVLIAPSALMAATINAQADATIMPAIQVVQHRPLSFGRLTDLNGAGGVVHLDEAGLVTPQAANLHAAQQSATSAAFNVTGAPNAHYSVVFNQPEFDIQRAGGAETMRVHIQFVRFANDPAQYPTVAGALPVGTTDAAGASHFHTWASLTIAAGQAPGVYTGNYQVTVNYW